MKHYVGLGFFLGLQDVLDTYRRSTLGPLWITFALGAQVAAIGFILGGIFLVDVEEYLPFLTVSLILWNFVVSTLNDSTNSYVHSQQMLRQIYTPSYLPTFRVLSKNLIIFGHNFSLVIFVLIFFRRAPGPEVFLSLMGLFVVVTVIYFTSTILGIAGTRYRDLSPIIGSILMVSFYLTPIIWMPDNLPEQFWDPILALNPLFHLMELVRGPVLGTVPSLTSWLVSVGLLIVFGVLALVMSRRYAWKIVYWL